MTNITDEVPEHIKMAIEQGRKELGRTSNMIELLDEDEHWQSYIAGQILTHAMNSFGWAFEIEERWEGMAHGVSDYLSSMQDLEPENADMMIATSVGHICYAIAAQCSRYTSREVLLSIEKRMRTDRSDGAMDQEVWDHLDDFVKSMVGFLVRISQTEQP